MIMLRAVEKIQEKGKKIMLDNLADEKKNM